MGLPVDVFDRKQAVQKITMWTRAKASMRLVVTAYSEFFVRAVNDPTFARVMSEADMVTPDGASVLAAVRFVEMATNKGFLSRLWSGLRAGGDIWTGKVGETVTGVYLFEKLTSVAVENDWKIFLLGGWNGVSERTAEKLKKRFPGIRVEWSAGETFVGTDPQMDKAVVRQINRFEPDILFVAYNPVKQEKWLASHKNILKAKVGIGVGGTFNEYLGDFRKAPLWMEKRGLKWLWRAIVEPKRLGRIFRAVVVFPWLVFRRIK